MQMKDVSDDELRQLEKNSRQPNQNPNEISDEQLIDMAQKIKKGQNPVQQSQQSNQNIVEPEMPKTQQTTNAQFTSQVNSNMNTNSNFWKINGLPSKGKFYPAGTEILGRPMKVLEVKKISSLGEDNGDFILNDIVRRTTTGIVHDELYVADKLYIIFWLRANTYRDSGYIVPFICQKCEKKSEYHFELDNLEVQQISDDFDPNKEIKLSDGDLITFDYLRIKDEIFIDRFKELNYNAVGDIDDELLAMAQMIKTINGKEQTLLQKYHWIIELEPGDYSYLRTYMEKKGMGIKPFVNITCKQCGGTAAVAVSFRSDFFIPEYKFE